MLGEFGADSTLLERWRHRALLAVSRQRTIFALVIVVLGCALVTVAAALRSDYRARAVLLVEVGSWPGSLAPIVSRVDVRLARLRDAALLAAPGANVQVEARLESGLREVVVSAIDPDREAAREVAARVATSLAALDSGERLTAAEAATDTASGAASLSEKAARRAAEALGEFRQKNKACEPADVLALERTSTVLRSQLQEDEDEVRRLEARLPLRERTEATLKKQVDEEAARAEEAFLAKNPGGRTPKPVPGAPATRFVVEAPSYAKLCEARAALANDKGSLEHLRGGLERLRKQLATTGSELERTSAAAQELTRLGTLQAAAAAAASAARARAQRVALAAAIERGESPEGSPERLVHVEARSSVSSLGAGRAGLLALGSILVLVAALAAAIFKDARDPTIRDSAEAAAVLGVPVLSTIPALGHR